MVEEDEEDGYEWQSEKKKRRKSGLSLYTIFGNEYEEMNKKKKLFFFYMFEPKEKHNSSNNTAEGKEERRKGEGWRKEWTERVVEKRTEKQKSAQEHGIYRRKSEMWRSNLSKTEPNCPWNRIVID